MSKAKARPIVRLNTPQAFWRHWGKSLGLSLARRDRIEGMDGRRIYIVAAFTFLAGLIGQAIPPPQNYKMDAWSRLDRIRYTCIYTIVGASVGAVLGSVIAMRASGPTLKRKWQFRISTLLLLTAAIAILSLGWKVLYEIFVF